MRKSKLLTFCFLIFFLVSSKAYSQNCDIDVVAEAVNANSGQSNGSVNFKMKDLSPLQDRFIVFDLTAVRNGVQSQVKLKSSFVGNLVSGKYEFLVVDKKRDKCAKEILVEIKEQ